MATPKQNICTDNTFLNMLDQKRRNALANVPPVRYDNLAKNPYTIVNPATGLPYTKFDLDMRRKAEILEYNAAKNNRFTNNLSKSERWAALVNGSYQRRTMTNEYIQNNMTPNGRLPACPIVKRPTTASDVPGAPMMLYNDPTVPLYNYVSDVGGDMYAIINDMFTSPAAFGYSKVFDIPIYKTVSVAAGVSYSTVTSIYLTNPSDGIYAMPFTITTPLVLQLSNTMVSPPVPNTQYTEPGALSVYVYGVFVRILFSSTVVTPSTPPTITTSFQYSSTSPLSVNLSIPVSAIPELNTFTAAVYLGTVSITGMNLRALKGYIYDVQIGVEYTVIPSTTEGSKYTQYFGTNLESVLSYANVTQNSLPTSTNCSFVNTVPTDLPVLSVSSP